MFIVPDKLSLIPQSLGLTGHRVEERITSLELSSNIHVCMVELVSTRVHTYKYMYIFLQIKRYNAMFLNRKLIVSQFDYNCMKY